MTEKHALLARHQSLVTDRTLTIEQYATGQKNLLREALDALKQQQHPDLDYIIGITALYDGDKYGIEIKNALNHLMRAYKNGQHDAGLALALIFRGAIPHVPQEYVNREKALQILKSMENSGNVKVLNDLSSFYLDEIFYTTDGGGYAPEDWFHQCLKYASEASERGFIGGFTMLGYLHLHGFGSIVVQNFKESFIYYQKALDHYDGGTDTEHFYSDALHNVGAAYYDGQGVTRDRKKGLALIQEAADKGSVAAQEWIAYNYDFLQKDGLIGHDNSIAYEENFEDLDLSIETDAKPEQAHTSRPVTPSEKVTKH